MIFGFQINFIELPIFLSFFLFCQHQLFITRQNLKGTNFKQISEILNLSMMIPICRCMISNKNHGFFDYLNGGIFNEMFTDWIIIGEIISLCQSKELFLKFK